VAISDLMYKARHNNKSYETKLLHTSNTPRISEGMTVSSEKPDSRDGNKDHKKGWSKERKVLCACRKLAENCSCIFHEW